MRLTKWKNQKHSDLSQRRARHDNTTPPKAGTRFGAFGSDPKQQTLLDPAHRDPQSKLQNPNVSQEALSGTNSRRRCPKPKPESLLQKETEGSVHPFHEGANKQV